MPAPEILVLESGDARCELCPALGGSVLSWTVGGQHLFRATARAALEVGDPLTFASFPLVPYSNRIGHGRFVWAGQDVALELKGASEPHALHGVGWQRAWKVEDHQKDQCRLIFEHKADGHWPWDFRAVQDITVGEAGLRLKLSATNLAELSVPLAFGHHPYFDQQGAVLQFEAGAVLNNGPDKLPETAMVPKGQFDFSQGRQVAGRDIDHCFLEWTGNARISWAGRPYEVRIKSTLEAAVVYIPPGSDSFCFEPVPHANNALNRPDLPAQMPSVSPDSAFEAEISFEVVRP